MIFKDVIFYVAVLIFVTLFNISFAVINNDGLGHLSGNQPVNQEDGSGDAVGSVLDKVSCALTSDWGKAIATIAIVALGIGLFLGKLSWGLGISTAVGVAMIFGASQIAEWLGGSAAIVCP